VLGNWACGGSGGGIQTLPTLSSIAVTSATNTLTAGQTQQYSAVATFSDESSKDVTSTAMNCIAGEQDGQETPGK
jgi:hypothetical protein